MWIEIKAKTNLKIGKEIKLKNRKMRAMREFHHRWNPMMLSNPRPAG
jgi:hypothetical protein